MLRPVAVVKHHGSSIVYDCEMLEIPEETLIDMGGNIVYTCAWRETGQRHTNRVHGVFRWGVVDHG